MAFFFNGRALEETRVALDQTPGKMSAPIQRGPVGALEDIAKTRANGQTANETDIIWDGHKWEIVDAEDGIILSNRREEEIAAKVAMDRIEVVSIHETVKTPARSFEHCVHLPETTPLESDVSHKYYAPGIGIVKDDPFELAKK